MHVKNQETAKEILTIQLLAYKIEAEIICFDGIPPLKETIDEIIYSDETYLGYIENGVLIGFLSYIKKRDSFQISKLVVDPSHFRRGIAKRLLEYFINKVTKGSLVIVSTGAKNEPAKRLYKLFGFVEFEDIEVAPDVFITSMKFVP
ncbi:putative acetyltransferase [Bacillus sp. TS-2]|nr:putative acetyltransferase [Bacillus sp. TS-2]